MSVSASSQPLLFGFSFISIIFSTALGEVRLFTIQWQIQISPLVAPVNCHIHFHQFSLTAVLMMTNSFQQNALDWSQRNEHVWPAISDSGSPDNGQKGGAWQDDQLVGGHSWMTRGGYSWMTSQPAGGYSTRLIRRGLAALWPGSIGRSTCDIHSSICGYWTRVSI